MVSLSLTDPGSEFQAPVIIIGPKDTTVVAGIQATLECVANARYAYLFTVVIYLCIIHLLVQVKFSSHINIFTVSSAKHTHTHTQSACTVV